MPGNLSKTPRPAPARIRSPAAAPVLLTPKLTQADLPFQGTLPSRVQPDTVVPVPAAPLAVPVLPLQRPAAVPCEVVRAIYEALRVAGADGMTLGELAAAAECRKATVAAAHAALLLDGSVVETGRRRGGERVWAAIPDTGQTRR